MTQANTDNLYALSTPPKASTTAAQKTQPTKMLELNVMPFYGDLEDESPRDFINKMK
ncbi:hypothetical protein H0H87_002328, partial [Tephrocybe sp. NHM501043]